MRLNRCNQEERRIFRAVYRPSTEVKRQLVERERNAQRLADYYRKRCEVPVNA